MSDVLCTRFQCERIALSSPGSFLQADGSAYPAVYVFVRTVEGQQFEAVVDVRREDEPVVFGVIQYVCRALRIDDPRDLIHADD